MALGIVYRYGFNGKEKDPAGEWSSLAHYDYGARIYNPSIGKFLSVDPLPKAYEGLYVGLSNNPVSFIDPDGRDTVDVVLNKKGKWNITKVQNVEGDDVFRVNDGARVTVTTFSEGDYKNRVNALNIESNSKYTLGIYHVSGAKIKGTGFYVTPGGKPDITLDSNKRLPDDVYTLADGSGGQKWHQPIITSGEKAGDVSARGIKVHPTASTLTTTDAAQWTDACFVVCSDYTINSKTNKPVFNQRESELASRWFNIYLGATKLNNEAGDKNRPGAVFKDGIKKVLIQKTN